MPAATRVQITLQCEIGESDYLADESEPIVATFFEIMQKKTRHILETTIEDEQVVMRVYLERGDLLVDAGNFQ